MHLAVERRSPASGHTPSLDATPVGVAVDPSGRILATVTLNGRVRLWHFPAGTPFLSLPGHVTDDNAAIAFSATGHLLATGGTDGRVRLWRIPSGKLVTVLKGHDGVVVNVTFSSDGKLLLTGGNDKTLRLWNTAGADAGATYLVGLNVRTVRQANLIGEVALSPDGLLPPTLEVTRRASGRLQKALSSPSPTSRRHRPSAGLG